MTTLLDCCKKRYKEELNNDNTNNNQNLNNIYINRIPTNTSSSRETTSLLIQKNIDTLINLQKIQYEAMNELKEIHELRSKMKRQ